MSSILFAWGLLDRKNAEVDQKTKAETEVVGKRSSSDEPRGMEALRIAVKEYENAELKRLREELQEAQTKLREARLMCPAAFARPGQEFVHRRDERMQNYDYDLFRYLGRTIEGTHNSPPNWLIFRHIDGTGYGDSYGAVNGGVRDVIGAWPLSDYWVYDKNGNYDKDVFCLPLEKCYCMRPIHEIYGYDDDEDEDEDEEDEEDADEE